MGTRSVEWKEQERRRNVGRLLKQVIVGCGLRQKDLAQHLDWTEVAVSRLVCGSSPVPERLVIVRILEVLAAHDKNGHLDRHRTARILASAWYPSLDDAQAALIFAEADQTEAGTISEHAEEGTDPTVMAADFLRGQWQQLGRTQVASRAHTAAAVISDSVFVRPHEARGADLINAVYRRLAKDPHTKIWILGQPGAGKTLALLRIVADAACGDNHPLLPVYLDAGQTRDPAKTFSNVLKTLKKRSGMRPVLILDGVDEVGESEASVQRFAETLELLDDYAVILSCRTHYYNRFMYARPGAPQLRFEIRPWTADDAKMYVGRIARQFGLDQDEVLHRTEELAARGHEVIERPLLLALVVDTLLDPDSRARSSDSWSISNLFGDCVDRWLQWEASKPKTVLSERQDKRVAVELLAWFCHSRLGGRKSLLPDDLRHSFSPFVHRDGLQYFGQPVQADDVLNDLMFHSLLERMPSGGYKFVHPLFQDYCAASFIFNGLTSEEADSAGPLTAFIHAEVALFLHDMIEQARPKPVLATIVRNLMEAFERRVTPVVGQQAGYFLGRIGTREARRFLEEQIDALSASRSPEDQWIRRAACVGLAFGGHKKHLYRLVQEWSDGLSAGNNAADEVNRGQQYLYYGDISHEGEAMPWNVAATNAHRTVRTLFKYLLSGKGRPTLAVDLLTLRRAIEEFGLERELLYELGLSSFRKLETALTEVRVENSVERCQLDTLTLLVRRAVRRR